MADWRGRLNLEYATLNNSINRLDLFIDEGTHPWHEMKMRDQFLLYTQLKVMRLYSAILRARLLRPHVY